MPRSALETITGFFVLVVAIGFFYTTYAFNRSTLSSQRYTVSALFDRVDGILEGSDIRLGGVKIGRVQSIALDPKTYQAIVAFALDATVRLPKDTGAEIVSESMMGGKYINLTPGADTECLVANSRIERTQSSVSLESLISKYMFSSPNK
jgi:phospholipid/cholesterol/gamma-HCH transport system substrate-binding protein